MGRALVAALLVLCTLANACACGRDGAPKGSGPHAVAARAAGTRGVPVGADTLANTRIGGPYGTVLAFRFRAAWTGQVRGVRFYAVRNSDGREGYSGGSGGTLRVSLAPDSGGPRHVPRGRALAFGDLAPPSRDAWPLVRFSRPAAVVAGRYYHVVFTNTDQQPRRNYVSVNALLAYGRRQHPPRTPDGMAVLLGTTADGGLTPRRWTSRVEQPGERYAPILDVVGAGPGQHLGLGYMEVWSSNPKPIGGTAAVRQRLGHPPRERITGAWLRVRRRAGATSRLRLRIERLSGGVLASASRSAPAIPGRRPRWVHVRFRRPAAVGPADDIALTATAAQRGAYEAFPLRDGSEFGFDARTVFADGYAQFTDAGDWVGWDQWGGHDLHNGDLQFALDLAPR
jgi:hypothetical protein